MITTQTHSGSPHAPAFGRRGWFKASARWTALIDATPGSSTEGQVVERYLYDPYGRVTFLKPDWSLQEVTGRADGTASALGNEILFTGYRWNPETGYYQVRHREFNPLMGRWMQRDPLGYVDGGNLYAGYFVMWGGVDPWGLSSRRTYANIHFNYVGGKHYAFRGSDQNVPRGVNLIYMDLPYSGDNRPYVLQIHYDPTGDQQTPTVLTISLNNADFGDVDPYFQAILRQEHLEGALREIKEGANATLRTGDVIFDLVKCVAMVAIPGPELVVAGTVIAKFGKDWGPKGIKAVWNKATKRYDVQATPGSQVSQDELRQAAQALRNEFRKAAPKKPMWDSWSNYRKVSSGGREYAQVGDRLYTRHAVDRMQPSGLGAPAGASSAGRSIAPAFVDDVIQNGSTTTRMVDGVQRTIHTSGSVQVVTEQGGKIVVTINPFSGGK